MSRNMDDYVEVNERIVAFHQKYPNGSLQGNYEVCTIGEETLIVYRAKAYRDGADPRPGIGTAQEPFPGKTNFTKGSEVQNAETSAWGRALAALGFEVKRGIASREEVELAQERNGKAKSNGKPEEMTSAQKGAITRLCNKLEIEDEHKPSLVIWAGGKPDTTPTKGQAGKLVDLLSKADDFDAVWKSAGLVNPRNIKPGEDGQTLRDAVEKGEVDSEPASDEQAEQLGVRVTDE